MIYWLTPRVGRTTKGNDLARKVQPYVLKQNYPFPVILTFNDWLTKLEEWVKPINSITINIVQNVEYRKMVFSPNK